MKRRLFLGGESIEYTLKRSARARRLRFVMHVGGALAVTAPLRVSIEQIESMLQTYTEWILRQQQKMKARTVCVLPASNDRAAYLTHKAMAKEKIGEYLAVLLLREALPKHTVQIKNHRSRWGSCSRRGMLNFNYRIALLPYSLMEYIIIHEVCHLYEMNHSVRFWTQVARFIPDHLERRKELQGYVWNKER